VRQLPHLRTVWWATGTIASGTIGGLTAIILDKFETALVALG